MHIQKHTLQNTTGGILHPPSSHSGERDRGQPSPAHAMGRAASEEALALLGAPWGCGGRPRRCALPFADPPRLLRATQLALGRTPTPQRKLEAVCSRGGRARRGGGTVMDAGSGWRAPESLHPSTSGRRASTRGGGGGCQRPVHGVGNEKGWGRSPWTVGGHRLGRLERHLLSGAPLRCALPPCLLKTQQLALGGGPHHRDGAGRGRGSAPQRLGGCC
jgi:hypothetical protein